MSRWCPLLEDLWRPGQAAAEWAQWGCSQVWDSLALWWLAAFSAAAGVASSHTSLRCESYLAQRGLRRPYSIQWSRHRPYRGWSRFGLDGPCPGPVCLRRRERPRWLSSVLAPTMPRTMPTRPMARPPRAQQRITGRARVASAFGCLRLLWKRLPKIATSLMTTSSIAAHQRRPQPSRRPTRVAVRQMARLLALRQTAPWLGLQAHRGGALEEEVTAAQIVDDFLDELNDAGALLEEINNEVHEYDLDDLDEGLPELPTPQRLATS